MIANYVNTKQPLVAAWKTMWNLNMKAVFYVDVNVSFAKMQFVICN